MTAAAIRAGSVLVIQTRRIHGKIENVLSQLTGTEVEIVGSGRTDAGTHAKGQVANFKTESEMSLAAMQEVLIKNLPQDIIVKKLEEVPERFHSRYHASGKQYSYYVWNQTIPSAFERNYSFHYPEQLDMKKMGKAAGKLTKTVTTFWVFCTQKVKKIDRS